MNFSIFDLLLAIIFSQGIFLAIAVQSIPNKNKDANNILTILLLFASTIILGRLIVYKYHNYFFWRLGAFLDTTVFLFGPFLYCYVRRLFFKENPKYRLKYIDYLLPFFQFLFFVWVITLSETEYIQMRKAGSFVIPYIIIELSGIFSLSFYTIKSYFLTTRFMRIEKDQLSYHQKVTNYINYLLLTVVIFTSLWIFSFINLYVFRSVYSYISYNSMWISLAFLMYCVGFYTLTKPEIFRLPLLKSKETTNELKEEQNRDSKDRLSNIEIEVLTEKIETALKDGIYLKPDLNLLFFAKKIDTTTNNLSWMLNNIYNKSFYEIINEHRIKEFIKKIEKQEHKHHTIIALAEEVGFNSKSTFNKSFKAVMNDTPSSYIKKMVF